MADPMRNVLCASCGTKIAKVAGTHIYTDLVCTNPLCEYQGAADLHQQRDAYISLLLGAGQAVSDVAEIYGLSRQRVYQIRNSWKAGV